MSTTACSGCSCTLRQGMTFTFKSPQGEAARCLGCSLRHWPLLKRSILIGLIVGTLLTLLNQGNIILSGSWEPDLYWKVPLTYCVPFLVATCGALTNTRS